MRRRPLLLLAALATVAVGAAPAAAQAPPDPVVVTLGGGRDTWAAVHVDCDGTPTAPFTGETGSIALDRTGPLDGTLPVAVSVSTDLDGEVTSSGGAEFVPGSDVTSFFVSIAAVESGPLTLTLEPGPGYQVGTPSSITIQHRAEPGPDCRTPLALAAGPAEQAIAVGELPAPVTLRAVAAAGWRLATDLPPGIGAVLGPDDPAGREVIWSGAATTPGTHRVAFEACRRRAAVTYCVGTTELVVTVRGAEGPAAPPAAPVSAPARFTG